MLDVNSATLPGARHRVGVSGDLPPVADVRLDRMTQPLPKYLRAAVPADGVPATHAVAAGPFVATGLSWHSHFDRPCGSRTRESELQERHKVGHIAARKASAALPMKL